MPFIRNSYDLSKLRGPSTACLTIQRAVRKIDEIKILLARSEINCLGLVETWLNSSISTDEMYIQNYDTIRFDRGQESSKRGGGGLVFYCKDNLDIICLTEYTCCTPDIECLWLGLKLVNTKLIVIGLIYRPPSGKVEKFIEHIEENCLSLRSQRNCEINLGGI